MFKQNINIVGLPILSNILEEIKDNLSFKFINFNKIDDFEKIFNQKNIIINNLVITDIKNKDFFIKKKIK